MHKHLMVWLHENEVKLTEMGVITENVRESRKDSLDPGVSVDHASKICLGQVSVWESGLMDMEVLEIETGNRLLLEHLELERTPNYDNILEKYLRVLVSGVAY